MSTREENSPQKNNITINTDGGSRGNPGPAAYGFVVKDDGKTIYSENGFLGVATNNQAEYTAVLKAYEWLTNDKWQMTNAKLGIQFILDSELVVRQLSGIYKIKDAKIKEYVKDIKEYEKKLEVPVIYNSVRREENKEADALVNQSLDENS